MALVKPIAQRHYSEDIGNRLAITIPSRKNWFLIIFVGVWLIFWLFGEIFVGWVFLQGIMNQNFEGPVLFILIWVTFWTVGGAFTFYVFFWQLVGREEIEITSDSITVSQIVFAFRRSKVYASEHIRDLRTSPMGINELHSWNRAWVFYGIGGGIIAFDYGAGTIRLGSGIDESEGKQIIAEIQQKYPQYKKQT